MTQLLTEGFYLRYYPFPGGGARLRLQEMPDAVLGLANRETFADDLSAEGDLLNLISQGQECPGVPHADLVSLQGILNLCGKLQQTQGVCDRRPVFADPLGQDLLRVLELRNQPLI